MPIFDDAIDNVRHVGIQMISQADRQLMLFLALGSISPQNVPNKDLALAQRLGPIGTKLPGHGLNQLFVPVNSERQHVRCATKVLMYAYSSRMPRALAMCGLQSIEGLKSTT